MVDSVDFASIESGVTASQFNAGTRKFYGVNTGGSGASTSGAISKIASLVRSGVFRLTLKATENNYDQMMIRIAGVTGCAEQILAWETVDNDDSDLASLIAVGNSRALLVQSLASDAASAAVQANSRVLLNQSRVSDIQSYLVAMSGMLSDTHSAAILGASHASDALSRAILVQSMASDAASAAQQGNSRILIVQSRLSDLDSRLVADVSDLASKIGNVSVTIGASDISDLASAVIAGLGFDPSDIASAVNVELGSRLSDILSSTQLANLRILTLNSVILAGNSDLRSLVSTTGGGGGATASDVASVVAVELASRLSDILSAAQQANSRVLVAQSMASDAHSAAVATRSLASDTHSLVTQVNSRVLLTQSMASDAHSAAVVARSLASDAHSAATQINSRVLLVQSGVSDVQSALGAGVTLGASSLSDIRSAVAANGVLKTGSEPTGVIGHTDTLASKIDWLTALSRNKITQTSGVQSLRNDADNSTIASATVADDGSTFTRGEFA